MALEVCFLSSRRTLAAFCWRSRVEFNQPHPSSTVWSPSPSFISNMPTMQHLSTNPRFLLFNCSALFLRVESLCRVTAYGRLLTSDCRTSIRRMIRTCDTRHRNTAYPWHCFTIRVQGIHYEFVCYVRHSSLSVPRCLLYVRRASIYSITPSM